jgi:protein TonB
MCVLRLIVDDQGNPRDIRVVRGLGFGLDARAIEAVKQWRFHPAMKDGHPVSVLISVEVGFHLN